MQHDMMRQPGQSGVSDNVGDVLASIRRLIAQDEDGKQMPGRPMGETPFSQKSPPQEEAAEIAAEPFVLGQGDLVAPQASEPDQDAPKVPRLHLASISAAISAGPAPVATTVWQPALIADWPQAQLTQVPMDIADSLPQISSVPQVDAVGYEPTLDPEEEAEIAEAEAALAKMVHVARAPAAELVTETPEAPLAMGEAPLEEPAQLPQNLFTDGGEDPETTLQQMIRSAIRDELQGDMGDRLSHNLRLTIRREVEAVIRELCAEA